MTAPADTPKRGPCLKCLNGIDHEGRPHVYDAPPPHPGSVVEGGLPDSIVCHKCGAINFVGDYSKQEFDSLTKGEFPAAGRTSERERLGKWLRHKDNCDSGVSHSEHTKDGIHSTVGVCTCGLDAAIKGEK